MATATSKLAQVATGTKTCQRCGRTKSLDDFQVSRLGRPFDACRACVSDAMRFGRKAGAARRRVEREQKAAEQPVVSQPLTAAQEHILRRVTRCAGLVAGAALFDSRLTPIAAELDALITDMETNG